MSSLYRSQRSELCKSVLSSHLSKRMTLDDLKKAMRLSLNLDKEWAVQARLSLAWGASAARRSSDMRGLLYRNMCCVDQLQTSEDNPHVSFLCMNSNSYRVFYAHLFSLCNISVAVTQGQVSQVRSKGRFLPRPQ